MPAPVVIFAIGNPSRGDDGLGPEICGRLEKWLENEGLAAGCELVEDFQLNIEHALDLAGRKLALFVDAGERTPDPYVFRRIFPSTAGTHSTHALPPEAILHVYRQTEGGEPPPAYVLCVRGEDFALGEGLAPAAEARVAAAMALLERLLRQAEGPAWDALAA